MKCIGPVFTCVATLSLSASGVAQAANLLVDGVTYTENFDTMTGNKGNTINPPMLPLNWTYTGEALNTGDGTDRALGAGGVANDEATFGTSFQFLTGGSTVDLTITYTGEQWYYGGSPFVNDFLDFEYSSDATSLTTGTWTQFDALDFDGPAAGLTGGAQATDGNNAAYRTTLSETLSLSNVAANDTVWIRWSSVDFPVGDQLAIDDFSAIATGNVIPEPASLALLGITASTLCLRRQHRQD